jgi:Bacterial Ig-like domain (group 3)
MAARGKGIRASRNRLWVAPAVAVPVVCLTLAFAVTPARAAPPSPPFTQCPAVGADTSCETLIVVNADGSVTIVSDPGQGPYDGSEDTLIGVQNNESVPLPRIHLSSATLAIYGFEVDGICRFSFTGNGYCSSQPPGSSGYEGPDTTFSGISANKRNGTINFTDSGGGLAAGAHTYFSLEQNVKAGNLAAIAPPLVTFTSTSPATADFNDATTVSATLTANGAPVAGETVTFKIESGAGGATCNGTTDAFGVASCAITPSEAAAGYQISASFAGNSNLDASSASEAFTVTHEEDALAYTGPASAANGKPVTLSGKLTTDDPSASSALSGKTVTLSIGSGTSAQSCSGTTDTLGVASCTITSLFQPAKSEPVSASFAGDSFYVVAAASGTLAISGVGVPNVGAASGNVLLEGLLLSATGGTLVAAASRQRRRRRGR